MTDKTDVIQVLFDQVRRDTLNEGFSQQVVLRLAARQKRRRVVLVGAALMGVSVFATQLPGVESVVARLMQTAILIESGSLLGILGSSQLLVFCVVVLVVLSNTTIALINALRG
jgi:hypothetical protein